MPNFNLTYQKDGENEQLYYKDAHNNDLYIRSCEDFAPAIIQEKSGNPIAITDGADCPIRKLNVIFEPIQDGSGDPSPDNIRPITGRDAVTVTRTGVNIFDGEVVNGRYNQGKFVESGSYRCSKNPMPCYPGMSVYFRDKSNAALALYVTLFTRTGEFISTASVSAGNWTIPAGSGARWFKVHTTASVYTAATPICIALNAPSAYAPYDGTSVTVQLGQTVYSGTAEIINGQGESDYALATFTGGFFQHPSLSDLFYKTNAISDARAGTAYCNQFKYTAKAAASLSAGEFTIDTNYTRIAIRTSAFTSETTLNAYLAEHPLQVAYPRATPQTLALTPASLSMLKEENTFSTDGTSIELEYVVDTKTYIDNLINSGLKTVVKPNDEIKIINENKGVE